MEYRQLGGAGFRVPVFSFGTATFGGVGELFKAWGTTGEKEATRLVDICIDHGVNMFDTADIYSKGRSEEVLGAAIKGRREQVILATKTGLRFGDSANEIGTSRYKIIKSCEASLKRLGTDYIDLYQMHCFDATTPIEETLNALAHLVQSGKVRYIGCSNFSGWQLMKSLGISEQYNLPRYATYQGYYSLIGRDYESELMPLGLDQNVGLMVWSPLGWGRLTGKIKRGQPLPETSRLHKTADSGPPIADEFVYQVVDVLDEIAAETGKTVPQIALNWLLQRPTVCNIIIGARNEEQLKQNLGAIGWQLTSVQVKRLDQVSFQEKIYPYWHHKQYPEIVPQPV